MGLCCALKTWTLLALIYSIIDFIVFTVVDILIIIALRSPEYLHSRNDAVWSEYVDGFKYMDGKEPLIGLLSTRLALRTLIIISVPLLFIGNKFEKRRYFILWEILFALDIVMLIGATTYFLITENKCGLFGDISGRSHQQANSTSIESDSFDGEDKSLWALQWARLTVFIDFAQGGIFLILHVLFLCCVHLRGLDMSYTKSEMKRFEQWDATVTPYRIPRARLGSLVRDDNTLELRSCRVPAYPSLNRQPPGLPPYYDNYAFKY